jgi:hypothetical protein
MARVLRSLVLSSWSPPVHRIDPKLQSRVFRAGRFDLGMDCCGHTDSECGVWDGGAVF